MKMNLKRWKYPLLTIAVVGFWSNSCKRDIVVPSSQLKVSTDGMDISAPSQASAAGFSKLTFQDEFSSINTIDTAATKAVGFKWYTDGAFGNGNALRSAYKVSGGVLTVTNSGSFNGNWVLASVSPQGNVGKSFKYAYFEARIKFNPTLGMLSAGFPAWWSFSRNHTVTGDPVRWGEIDFFEAYTTGYANYSGGFIGTTHDWANNSATH